MRRAVILNIDKEMNCFEISLLEKAKSGFQEFTWEF